MIGSFISHALIGVGATCLVIIGYIIGVDRTTRRWQASVVDDLGEPVLVPGRSPPWKSQPPTSR